MSQWRVRFFVFCLLGLFCSGVSAANFQIVGLTGELKDNFHAYLSVYQDSSVHSLRRHQLQSALDGALNPYGYYHSSVEVKPLDEDTLSLIVDKGQPVTIASSSITLVGKAEQDADFASILHRYRIAKGDTLNHETYDQLKSQLASLALRKGYFDYQFEESRLEVIPSQLSAEVVLVFNSGPRYRFGEVIINGSQIQQERVERLASFEKGELFNQDKLADYQMKLFDTGWFGNVAVLANWQHATNNHEAPIEVNLSPAAKNTAQVGGGYTSNYGLRGTLRWKQPWYNTKGHSFQSELNLSAPEQSLSLGYRIPTIDASSDYYAISFDVANVDYLDTESFSSTLSFERTWRFNYGWEGRLFMSYLHERYRQASEENESQLTLPGFETVYLSENPPDSAWSHGHRFSLEYSDPNLLSDARLLRLTGDSHIKWSISDRHALQVSGRWGANMAEDIQRVPASLRFFAGGTNSLRGYKFDSISPVDSSGELTGGLNLATVAIDYQYQLFSSLWGGVFFDVGDAFNEHPDWKRGTGISLELRTKYLPIKLDVAKGLDAEEDELRLHLSFGVQF